MQGQYTQINEIVQLAALAVMIDATYFLGKAFSSDRSNSISKNHNKEEVGLLKEFMGFNPELQRGAVAYGRKMRKAYQKTKT